MLPFARSVPVLLVLLLLAAGGFAPIASAAQFAGKVSSDGRTVAGVEVFAYPAASHDFTAAAVGKAGPVGADGLFQMELPPGQYYLLARGAGLFSYYGRNPLALPEQGLTNINLLMVPAEPAVPTIATELETGVVGLVSEHGQPVAGAVVTVYPDLSSQFKGMGLAMAAPTDAGGLFELPLAPGTYYLVVRVRRGGAMAGPLQAGDLFGYLPANPLAVRAGEVARVHIPVIAVPEKVERHAASLFGNTRISGRILDAEGQPVAGLRALLYADSAMLNRPLFVSQPTGADGAFVLSFPAGGTYFLAARNELGGTPAPGELYGRYQSAAGEGVTIRTGASLEQIEIRVEEVY